MSGHYELLTQTENDEFLGRWVSQGYFETLYGATNYLELMTDNGDDVVDHKVLPR